MEKDEKIVLFTAKNKCCGCGACSNVCPKNAIVMTEDEYGFLYPKIDENLCVHCLKCKKVCAFQAIEDCREPQKVYVVSSENKEHKKKSSSGGVFVAVAMAVISQGGVVYGASYTKNLDIECLRIEKKEELEKLQGSKYVQCYMKDAYKKIKKDLKNGRLVLFSGTPCQVAAVKHYIGEIPENLITMDIICHGVPSQKMFKDYIKLFGSLTEFTFRDKKRGWEDYFIRYKSKFCYRNIYYRLSSYYEYFIQGKICRDSCYTCKYASKERYGDLTVGDYWGIREAHPELLQEAWWKERLLDGISCVLVNTNKGNVILKQTSDLRIAVSDYEKVKKANGQLHHPVELPSDRAEILALFKEKGWRAVDQEFLKSKKKSQIIKIKMKTIIPIKLKKIIKNIIRYNK